MNPMRTVRDMKSARNPSPINRAISSSAAAIERDHAGEGDVFARLGRRQPGQTSGKQPAAVAESAPTTRWRDDPSSAKASSGIRIV